MRRAALAGLVLVAGVGVGLLLRPEPDAPRAERPRQALLGLAPAEVELEGAAAAAPAASTTGSPAAPATPATPAPPTPEAVARLEGLLEADDLPGLRAFVEADRSWARLEALRQLLERGGREQLPGLLALFGQGDVVIAELLGDACAAGGDAALAEQLATGLRGWRGPAQRAAASAVLAIDADPARGAVSPRACLEAVEALQAQATGGDVVAAEAACDALGVGRGERVGSPLRALATDRGLAPEVRQAAIEALDPAVQGPLWSALAADHPDHPVGRLAAQRR